MKASIKQFFSKASITVNRTLGRTYIPNPLEHLYIEVSSICNLGCRFCAYPKKTLPKKVMPTPFFKHLIDRAVEYGYRDFGLTPLTGDVFVDPEFMEKLAYLEAHEGVERYHFFTNFTLPKKQHLTELLALKKLSRLSISIYGHDEESFCRVSEGSKGAYRRLVENITFFSEHAQKIPFRLGLGIRTLGDFRFSRCESDLCRALRNLQSACAIPIEVTTHYNNWGGLITPEDVAPLGISLAHEDEVYKNGPCSLLFYKNIVLVDGRLNACACRDVNATMVLGDLNHESFHEILSPENPRYRSLIQAQNRGEFEEVCRCCDMYRSIYRNHRVYKTHQAPPSALPKRFWEALS